MRIGVTGNYASGKGTVCEIFRQYGAHIIDTDLIARDIVQPGSIGLKKIINSFGIDFLTAEGFLDRKKLGIFVFSDPARVSTLNSILHPLILEKTLSLSPNKDIIYMINAPVLFEAKFETYMDSIIVISSKIEQSIERGINRDGLTRQEIEKRLSHQISLNEKLKRADYVIDNSGTLENTRTQTEAIWNNLIISSQKLHT